MASSAPADAAAETPGAEGGHDQRDHRERTGDDPRDRQYERHDSNHAGDAPSDNHPVGTLLTHTPGCVAAAFL